MKKHSPWIAVCLLIAFCTSVLAEPQSYSTGWKSNPNHHKGLSQIEGHPSYKLAKPPVAATLRAKMSKTYNQLDMGSCTCNAGASAFDFAWFRGHGKFVYPARLDMYRSALLADGTYPNDAGSYTSTILKLLREKGTALEACMPYVPARLTAQPPACADKARGLYKAVKAYDVPSNDGGFAARQTIATIGIPVMIGGYIFNDIFTPKKAKIIDRTTKKSVTAYYVGMPKGNPVGGHEMLIVAYDDELVIAGIKGWVLLLNSWDTTWGDGGYAWFPQAYIFNSHWFEDFGAIEITS